MLFFRENAIFVWKWKVAASRSVSVEFDRVQNESIGYRRSATARAAAACCAEV